MNPYHPQVPPPPQGQAPGLQPQWQVQAHGQVQGPGVIYLGLLPQQYLPQGQVPPGPVQQQPQYLPQPPPLVPVQQHPHPHPHPQPELPVLDPGQVLQDYLDDLLNHQVFNQATMLLAMKDLLRKQEAQIEELVKAASKREVDHRNEIAKLKSELIAIEKATPVADDNQPEGPAPFN